MLPDEMPPDIKALWEKYLTRPLSDAEAAALLSWLENHPNAVPQKRRESVLSNALGYMFAPRASTEQFVNSVQSRLKGRVFGAKSGRFAASVMAHIGEKSARPKRATVLRSRLPFGLVAAFAILLFGAIVLLVNRSTKISEAPNLDLSDFIVQSGQELTLNAEEYFGRKILTRERSKAFIRFKDGTTVDLDENTLLKLSPTEAQKGKELETQSGRVTVNAAPQPKDRPLKIQSPHGTVTVVGTVFSITVDPKGTSVDLLKGAVNLTRREDNASLRLAAGQRAVLAPGIVLAATPIQFVKDPLWTPAELTTAAWYDAADADTITHDKGSVSEWRDKSGNDRHATQSRTQSSPTFGKAQIGGINVVSFDSNKGTLLLAPDAASLKLDGTGGANVFAVMNYQGYTDQKSGFQSILSKGDLKSTSTAYGLRVNDDNSLMYKAGSHQSIGVGGLQNKDMLVGGLRNDATRTVEFYVNGNRRQLSPLGAVTSNNNEALLIGGRFDSRRRSTVQFGEIIIVPGALSLESRQKIEGYLAHKWDLAANLPVDHPYKSAAPKTTANENERGGKTQPQPAR